MKSFKFLGVHITDKLNWSTHTDSVVKKVQQHLFNLRRLKKFGLSPKTLANFYRCTIESILSYCSHFVHKCVYIPVGEHFFFANIILTNVAYQ